MAGSICFAAFEATLAPAGSLREQGYSAQEVDAVLALRPQRLGDVAKRLAAVRAFAALPEAPALAAANKRIGNILKKADGAVDPHVSQLLLREDAEKALYAMTQEIAPRARSQFESGDYTGSLQTLAYAALGRRGPDVFWRNAARSCSPTSTCPTRSSR